MKPMLGLPVQCNHRRARTLTPPQCTVVEARMEVEMLRGEERAEHLELALSPTLLPRVQIPEGLRQVDVHTCRLHGLSCDDVQQPALHLAHQAGHL